MTLKRALKQLCLASVALFLFLVCVYALFPTARIDQALAALLSGQGLSLSPGCRRTVLPGLAWDDARLFSDRGVLFSAGRLTLRPLLLPLAAGRLDVAASAAIGNGHLRLVYGTRGRDALQLETSGITLADIPFFLTVLGARATGDVRGEGRLTRTAGGVNGDIRLEVGNMGFSGIRLGSFPLPDAAGLKTRGMVRITDGRARLESFTLEGDGIYMRLSGEIPTGASAARQPLALTLEIMPRAEFMERQKLVFLLLAKFMASPGVYRIPVRGTLLKPEII